MEKEMNIVSKVYYSHKYSNVHDVTYNLFFFFSSLFFFIWLPLQVSFFRECIFQNCKEIRENDGIYFLLEVHSLFKVTVV